MNIFKHDARIFKFEILKELCDEAFEDDVSEERLHNFINRLIPTKKANYRCCTYKEKEILRQRARIAMGNAGNDRNKVSKKQIVQVIEAACDACSLHAVRVTDNCRKCMAKSCQSACNFSAMKMGDKRAEIDYDKCRECGACARACQYSAIVITKRPCFSACPVGAMKYDEDNIAYIDEDKCINCGRCLAACPFGAIQDRSQLLDVIKLLRNKEKVTAIFAPSIQGQYGRSTLSQIREGFLSLGFSDAKEVALGADIVAYEEEKELIEHKEKHIPLTTSCCPAFVNMAKMYFPEVFKNNMSSTVSPMIAIARLIKKNDPDMKVVFVGPCVAKKQEVQESFADVDYAITYEEYEAMLISRHINLPDLKPQNSIEASAFGRNFAQGGGVSKAVAEIGKEKKDEEVTSFYADGGHICKQQLQLIKNGRFNFDILEGMCCPDGCLNGPCTVEDVTVARMRMNRENAANKKLINESLNSFDYFKEKQDMDRPKDIN